MGHSSLFVTNEFDYQGKVTGTNLSAFKVRGKRLGLKHVVK